MKREEAEKILRLNFHIDKFYDRQWEVIEKLLNHEKVLLIEKTGFGKSLCFQFPAVIFKGLTIVFSPLIALMRDQVKKLKNLGIPAEIINSECSIEEIDEILFKAKAGLLKILYIAPERQENAKWSKAVKEFNISMIVIDEAHCISTWGHDFRPSFRKIAELVKKLPQNFPLLAATATATKRVEQDIAEQIGNDSVVLRGELVRENFRLFVSKVKSEEDKMIWLEQYLGKLPGSGIIYAGTRADTDIFNHWLNYIGFSSTAYHAGLSAEQRIEIEKGMMNNKWKCIISTNALGMGIDKPDIRFIIHTQFPASPVHYYQEIGRAGRDGKPTYLILLYNPKDIDLPMAFIDSAKPGVMKYFKVIDALKTADMDEISIVKKTNLRRGEVRIILSDLIEQNIIRFEYNGRIKMYTYKKDTVILDMTQFELLREKKLQELDDMIAYAECKTSRMNFLCSYLGDENLRVHTNCDNTVYNKLELRNNKSKKINEFTESFFPVIESTDEKSNLKDGVASSYYALSDVGATLHKCKYENGGNFPNRFVKIAAKAFKSKFKNEKFDHLFYVPPTKSGELVKNFAVRLSKKLDIPVSHDLIKIRKTEEQKAFENGYLKYSNIAGAFGLKEPKIAEGKKVLIIDDIYDSGATVREIGRYLTKCGAVMIAPLVIAKTVGGDLVKSK